MGRCALKSSERMYIYNICFADLKAWRRFRLRWAWSVLFGNIWIGMRKQTVEIDFTLETVAHYVVFAETITFV